MGKKGKYVQLTEEELEQESWFLETLKEFYDQLNLTKFTTELVQCEIYKNYWGHSFSTKQIQHIWTLNIEPKYTDSNIFQSSQDSEFQSNIFQSSQDSEFPASLQGVAGHNIPPPRGQGRPGQGVKQTEQGLNIVSNLSPHRYRKIACWIETGQFGLISEIGGAYGLQKEVLYPTQKCNHIFNPKVNDSLPKISGYELIAPFLKENQAAYITFANISGKEAVVTIDSQVQWPLQLG